ncbi:MAG TPA: PAS domain-containing protein, partial [Candidatus Obscuribacterales bacterium]
IYYQAKQQWLEPTPRQSLLSALRHAVLDGLVYIPVVGLAAFAVWNHRLSREVKRRQQAENRFQALADNTPGIIYQYVLRPDGTEAFLYISSRCRELWGVEAAAALEEARHLWERVHPDDLAQLRASVFRSARSLTPWQQEWRILTPTGQEKWLQASAQPQAQADGEVIWDGFVFDITARKTTEIALRKSESRFQRLADNVPGVLYGYRFRPDGTDEFTYISSGFTEVYGFPPDSALQDSAVVWRMTHPDDVERVRRSVMESYQTLRVWQAQYRVITPAGELKWLQGIARPTQEANGDVVWDGLIIDISDRKAAEAALSASDRRFRNMAANVPGAIFQYVLRADGTDNVNYMSPGCYDRWEISSAAAEQDAQQLWQLVHPDDRAAMLASVRHSAHTLEPWSWQWRIITPSGKTKWLEAGGRPERQDNGDVVWDSLIMDISDRKYAEVALRTSESRLTTLISNLPGFVYRVAPDPSRTADFISQGIHDLTGYPPEAYIDNRVTSLGQQTHPLDRDRVGN